MKDSVLYTEKVFDSYEKRFARARAEKILRDLSDDKTKEEIRREAREMLCYDRIPAPKIKIITHKDEVLGSLTVRSMQFSSWEHCYGEATLLIPKGEGPHPAILLCPGHGNGGRLYPCYQKMALMLANAGAVVLVSDNLGQGSREQFGHSDATLPFHLGITLQGMIVKEANAWIEWLSELSFIDSKRIGACGNSGGGTITMFLTATCKKLAAVASTGYPSELAYVHMKEKKHCPCNLLKGCAHLADMWEIYGAFAPKPLFLEQGKCDYYFPQDVFKRTVRKVKGVYEKLSACENFSSAIADTKHGWEDDDRRLILDFFTKQFSLTPSENEIPQLIPNELKFSYPDDAATTNEVANAIMNGNLHGSLPPEDYFIPTVNGTAVDRKRLDKELFDHDPMRILAQMELALYK